MHHKAHRFWCLLEVLENHVFVKLHCKYANGQRISIQSRRLIIAYIQHYILVCVNQSIKQVLLSELNDTRLLTAYLCEIPSSTTTTTSLIDGEYACKKVKSIDIFLMDKIDATLALLRLIPSALRPFKVLNSTQIYIFQSNRKHLFYLYSYQYQSHIKIDIYGLALLSSIDSDFIIKRIEEAFSGYLVHLLSNVLSRNPSYKLPASDYQILRNQSIDSAQISLLYPLQLTFLTKVVY